MQDFIKNSRIWGYFRLFLYCVPIVPFVWWVPDQYPLSFPKVLILRFLFLGLFAFLSVLFLTKQLKVESFQKKYFNTSFFFVIFIFSLLVSSIFAYDRSLAFLSDFNRGLGFVYYFLIFIYYFSLKTFFNVEGEGGKNRLLLIHIFSYIAVALCVVLSWQKIVNFSLENYVPRIGSMFGNPSFLGSFLVIPVFLSCLFFVSTDKKWQKILSSLSLFLCLFATYLSGTRSALLGIVCGFLTILLLYILRFFWQKKNSVSLALLKKTILSKKVLVVAVVLLISVVGFSSYLLNSNNPLIERILTISDKNSSSRLLVWGMSIKGFAHDPVFGKGLENYLYTFHDTVTFDFYKAKEFIAFDKPHNYLIEVLLEVGIFGLLAYIGLIISFVWVVLKSGHTFRQKSILVGAMLGYLVNLSFLFETPLTLANFAFLLALGPQAGGVKINESIIGLRKFKVFLIYFIISSFLVGSIYFFVYTPSLISADIGRATVFTQSGNIKQALNIFNKIDKQSLFINRKSHVVFLSNLVDAVWVDPRISSNLVTTSTLGRRMADRLLAKYPDDPDMLEAAVKFGIFTAKSEEDYVKVKALLDRRISLYPHTPINYILLARYHYARNEKEKALEILNYLESKYPLQEIVGVEIVLMKYKLGKTDESYELAKTLLPKLSNEPHINFVLFLAKQKKDYQLWAEAEIRLYKLTANVLHLSQAASAYKEAGDKQKALELAKELINKISNKEETIKVEEFIKNLK